MQAHHIGCGEQRIQRHRLGADSLARFGIARRRIVIADAATERREGLRHGHADGTEADQTDQQAVESGKIVRHHAGPERAVIAGLDFRIGPGKPAQQRRGSGHRIFGDSTIAAAGNITDGNSKPHERLAIEPIDAGAGDLHQLKVASLEQRGRELRADRRDDQSVDRTHQRGHIGIVRFAICHMQR